MADVSLAWGLGLRGCRGAVGCGGGSEGGGDLSQRNSEGGAEVIGAPPPGLSCGGCWKIGQGRSSTGEQGRDFTPEGWSF